MVLSFSHFENFKYKFVLCGHVNPCSGIDALLKNIFLTKCCASLKLDFHPAPLVQGMLRFSEAGVLAIAGVKTTCSIGFEKSVSIQGLKPPAPKVLKNRRLKPS